MSRHSRVALVVLCAEHWIYRANNAPEADVGLGQNFTPEPSVSAELHTQNDGTVIIEKTK